MTYFERVTEIRKAIVAGIRACEVKILKIGKHPIGTSRINGIAVEVIPFEQIFSIHFRDDTDEKGIEYPEWKYWNMYKGDQDNVLLLEKLNKEYEESGDSEKYMLMLGTAVAEALLCSEIVDILKSYSMAKYFKLNELGGNPFDFVVLDLDGCVDANFCEIVKWKRNICQEAFETSKI